MLVAKTKAPTISLAEIAKILDAECRGDGECQISGIASIANAKDGELTFLTHKNYRKLLKDTKASAILLTADDAKDCSINCIIMKNPYAGYAKVAQLFEHKPTITEGIHPSVVTGDKCHIHPSVSISANCVIGNNVTINENAVIGPNCVIGDNCKIGAQTKLHPRVTLYHGVTLGQRCIFHSGVVIGSDGFGNAQENGRWIKIPQLGGVLIGNDVEVGANTTIDRGALDDTVIEDGVKLDNQIQIGHNVCIGSNTAMAGCVAVAGSTTIGKNCAIGGGTCIAGHISIADNVTFTGMSGVYTTIDQPGLYSSGTGVQETKTWIRNVSRLRHLDELTRKLLKLEKQIAKLTKSETE